MAGFGLRERYHAPAAHALSLCGCATTACDQCRKSKCKCERNSPNEPCKNCILLNTRTYGALPRYARHTHGVSFIAAACTFLGPSKKRGPPKGYIDAIEARLHQTEALVGILLGSGDPRAQALFAELSQVCSSPWHPVSCPVC